MFGFGIFDVLIIIAGLALQYFFSTRNHIAWGVFIPIIFTGVIIWQFVTNRIESPLAFILIFLLGLIFLIEEWHSGRKALQRKQQKELQKMQTHDIT